MNSYLPRIQDGFQAKRHHRQRIGFTTLSGHHKPRLKNERPTTTYFDANTHDRARMKPNPEHLKLSRNLS